MEKRTYFMYAHNDESGLWCEFPDLPGCVTDGETPEELMKNAAEALECWILSMREHGCNIPEPSSIEVLKAREATCEDKVVFTAPVTGTIFQVSEDVIVDNVLNSFLTNYLSKIDYVTSGASSCSKKAAAYKNCSKATAVEEDGLTAAA